MDISVVIPVNDEQDNLKPLCEKLIEALLMVGRKYEIIFVNDGSSDGSWSVISQLTQADNRIKAIDLKKNYGQTTALSAGFDYAKGEIIITMDADLQNDPRDIPKLLEKINQGFDVVSGWRKKRNDPFWSKRLPSIIANKIISKVTAAPIHDFGCTLKAYKRDIIKNLKLYGEMHRFLPAYAMWLGAKVAEIEAAHYVRSSGRSKYGLGRTFKVILDLITTKFLLTFGTKPSYVFGGIGIILFLVGILTALFVTIRALFFTGVWVSPLIFITTICLISSVQFILMGLLGEISIRTYHEAQDKPTYLIANKLGLD